MYSSEVTTDITTVYAYAVKGTTTSNIINFATGAGTAITLNAPSVVVSNLVANGIDYNAVFDATYNTAGVEFTPSATLSAQFTPDGGVAQNVVLPYTVTERGSLTVTASAEGFTSAETTVNVFASYEQRWQSPDYSSLIGLEAVQAALGETWSQQDGHGRWAMWKDQTYNFYQQGTATGSNITINTNIAMRNVVVLAEGLGLGRNVTGGEAISIKNTLAGEIVTFEIYNGYGNDINKGVNTYMSYALSDGASNPSMSSKNSALLVQAAIYEPSKTTFTAKYYNSKGWEDVYAYTYNAETMGGWPGTKLTPSADGLYEVSFASLDAPEKIIFNNGNSGDGNQTDNLDFVDGAAYCFDGEGVIYNFSFSTNKGWSNIYAYTYANETPQIGSWPGPQITAADGSLTFVSTTEPEYVIFNNGSGAQTSDLVFENGKAYTFNSTYVVAGTEELFGSDWNTTDENNVMDENLTLTLSEKNLAAGTYAYKVVVDGSWDTSYPAENKEITIAMAGKYTIVITINPFTKEVSHDVEAISLPKSITAAGYATICSAYALDFAGTGLTAYIAKEAEGNNVEFEAVTTIPANTGVLLKGDKGDYNIAVVPSSSTDVSANLFVGVLENTVVDAGTAFVLMASPEVGFYKNSKAFTVGANTAYIPADVAPARSFIGFDEDSQTTSISEKRIVKNEGVVYNLNGQRVAAPQRGLYIVGGKKVVMK